MRNTFSDAAYKSRTSVVSKIPSGSMLGNTILRYVTLRHVFEFTLSTHEGYLAFVIGMLLVCRHLTE
jgi:hypothetical protein